MSLLLRDFRDATLLSVDDLSNALETRPNITDRRKLIDIAYVECVLMLPSELMIIIEIDIRNKILPRRVTVTDPPTNLSSGR